MDWNDLPAWQSLAALAAGSLYAMARKTVYERRSTSGVCSNRATSCSSSAPMVADLQTLTCTDIKRSHSVSSSSWLAHGKLASPISEYLFFFLVGDDQWVDLNLPRNQAWDTNWSSAFAIDGRRVVLLDISLVLKCNVSFEWSGILRSIKESPDN